MVHYRLIVHYDAMNEIAIASLQCTSDAATSLPEDLAAGNAAFFSALSHELRTPVTAIKALAQGLVLHWDDLPAEKRYFYVERVLRSSLRLEHLVNDLSMAAGLLPGTALRIEAVDLAGTVADAVDEVRMLHTDHVFGVVPDPGPSMVTADRQRLAQVLVNLLQVATRDTRPRGAVTVRWFADRPMIRVEVCQHGHAMSEIEATALEARLAIAVPLYQQPRRTPESDLGLFISNSLVAAMGGVLGVQSTLGAGTVFWFTLPQTA
jgi:signal transduction histidine kinase